MWKKKKGFSPSRCSGVDKKGGRGEESVTIFTDTGRGED